MSREKHAKLAEKAAGADQPEMRCPECRSDAAEALLETSEATCLNCGFIDTLESFTKRRVWWN